MVHVSKVAGIMQTESRGKINRPNLLRRTDPGEHILVSKTNQEAIEAQSGLENEPWDLVHGSQKVHKFHLPSSCWEIFPGLKFLHKRPAIKENIAPPV